MTEQHPLRLTRTFHASIDEVFAAFADPALLKEWAAPEEHQNEAVDVDFCVGGRYRRVMRFPDGSRQILAGSYVDIRRPTLLVYTFAWETIPAWGESVVRIDLQARGGTTDVTVTHTRLPDEVQSGVNAGWEQCFDKLANLLGATRATRGTRAPAR